MMCATCILSRAHAHQFYGISLGLVARSQQRRAKQNQEAYTGDGYRRTCDSPERKRQREDGRGIGAECPVGEGASAVRGMRKRCGKLGPHATHSHSETQPSKVDFTIAAATATFAVGKSIDATTSTVTTAKSAVGAVNQQQPED